MRNRRTFIKHTTAALAAVVTPGILTAAPSKKIRVLVWDERQPEALKAYGDYLGNVLADELRKNTRLEVRSVALDDAEQGIDSHTLRHTDVLIWWGHVRHGEVSEEKSKEIAALVSAGKMAYIGLHSAHWSNPFVELMGDVTRQRIRRDTGISEKEMVFQRPELLKALPPASERPGPYVEWQKYPNGDRRLKVYLPNCVFPYVANDGKPSTLKAMKEHPVLKGLPTTLVLPQTEMYGEPFHVPEPDELLLEEYWENGHWFRSGMVWNLGSGKVLYFRPGHETYPVFKEQWVIRLLQNAIAWMAPSA